MGRIEDEIVINRPVEAVFDFVADERNEPLYNPDIARAEQVTDGPIGKGTRFVASMRKNTRPRAMLIELTEFERPRRLSSRAEVWAADVSGTMTFDPDPAGTRMRWSWEIRAKGVKKLLTPVLVWLGRRQEIATWTNLKRHLEGC